MLVLARKVGQRIVVPDLDLTVTVLECHGNTVRLGVAAPADVDVFREEVWRRLDGAGTNRRRRVAPPPRANGVQPCVVKPTTRGARPSGDRRHGIVP